MEWDGPLTNVAVILVRGESRDTHTSRQKPCGKEGRSQDDAAETKDRQETSRSQERGMHQISPSQPSEGILPTA